MGSLLLSAKSKIWGPKKIGALCGRTSGTPVGPALGAAKAIGLYIESIFEKMPSNSLKNSMINFKKSKRKMAHCSCE
jgi:hypothetical protein